MTNPIVARSRRASPVLVCSKCLKRSPRGARIRRELKHQIEQRSPTRKTAPRLVSTNCFGLCPKRAVVLASGRSLDAHEYVLVTRPREVEVALTRLLPAEAAGS